LMPAVSHGMTIQAAESINSMLMEFLDTVEAARPAIIR
jgi:hypothetical protein